MTLIAIAGSALVTYLVRAAPLALTFRVRPAPAAARYFAALPIAIIAALVGPAVIAPGAALTHGIEPLGALAVIGAVVWRRSLLVGVIAGIAAVALVRAVM